MTSPLVGSLADPKKLRILCLHGYLQSAEIFRSRIGSMRKAMKRQAEFLFIDAPFIVDASQAEAAVNSGTTHGRSWWSWKDLEPTRPSKATIYSGWEESQQIIEAALAEHAPIDVLLGFSQGATAAALFLSHAQQQGTCHSLKGAILIGGFLPRDDSYAAQLMQHRVTMPAIFVCGEKDELVPIQRSQQLWETWDQQDGGGLGAGLRGVTVYKHPGAHMVPTCSGAFKAELQGFLGQLQGEKNA